MTTRHSITLTVNGESYQREVEPRMTLVDFLRHELRLTGTHVGCEHGVCGACSIMLDGVVMRSCLLLAVQADGAQVRTVEGLRNAETGELHPVQQAFVEKHGLQCGFCTPAFLVTVTDLLENNPNPSDEEIKEAIGGNLCRCTGYQSILESVRLAAQRMQNA